VTDNLNLKYLFLDECAEELADCWNTTDEAITDLWVLNYDVCGCPYCACGGYSNTDRWQDLEWNSAVYDSDTGEFDYALYDCVDCRCTVADDIFFNIDRRTCSSYDAAERTEADCTEQDALLTCWQENNGDVPETDEDTICTDDTFDTYCGFRKVDMIAARDPDIVCVEEDIEDAGTWDCFENFLCEAVFDKDELADTGMQCAYNKDASFTARTYDCVKYKWLSETYKVNLNFSCCTTDKCNVYEDADWEECESSSVAADILAVREECEYGDRGVSNSDFIKAVKCGKDLPQDKYEVCDIIGDYWKWVTACDCKYYQLLEKNMANDEKSIEVKQALQLKFDTAHYWTKSSISLWNDAYECGKTFECDITDGVEAKKGNILAMVCVAVAFIMYY
jgi:hypothetical protein